MNLNNSLNGLMLSKRENEPNSVFLAFNQASLRLRHLTQIIGYNLTGLSSCSSLYTNPLPSYLPHPEIKNGYYFTLETLTNGKPDYTSKLQPSTSPNWESFDCKAIFPVHLLSLKGLVVRVWLKENEVEEQVTSWGVNFSGLVPLSSKTPPPYEYAPNTLIFRLRGRYYTSYDCVLKPPKEKDKTGFKLHQGCSLALSETKPSYSVTSLCRLHGSQRELRKEEKKKEELRKALELKEVKRESKIIILEKEVENMKIKVCLLMEQLEVEMNKLRSIKLAADNQDAANQDKGIELLEKYQNLNRFLSSLKNQQDDLVQENENLQNVNSQVKERRCQLLSQLNLIFPIEQNRKKSVKYSICKIPLPDAESPEWNSDQSLSVSLGFVAQLFVKMAFLLNIPLKYPITLRGSLSSIADLTSTQLLDVEPQFPLYTKGKEREKLHFNYGVFLLNKNIAQLRWNCGLSTSNLRPTLYNIWHLLKSLHDVSFPTKAHMPDTTISSLIFPESVRQVIQTPVSLLQHKTPRLLLNPLSPKNFKSLPDTPSSPKSLRKKGSLEDDSFLCTASDTDVKAIKTVTDERQGESEEKKLGCNNTSHFQSRRKHVKQNYDNVTKLKQTSCSLDQGINSIIDNKHEAEFIRTISLNSSLIDSNISKASSGSFPSIAKKVEEENNDPPFSRFHEQTTQLLKSWHENYPSPYHSGVIVSNSLEKLENSSVIPSDLLKENHLEKSEHVIIGPSQNFDHVNCQNMNNINVNSSKEVNCVKIDNEDETKINPKEFDNIGIDESKKSASENLEQEMGFSFDDLDIDGDSFLKDVESRTANLASQNCSFKFSFSKTSFGDDKI